MSNLLPIAAAKVLKVPVIVFTSLHHFPIVPVVPSDAIIIGSCIHVAYNAAGFGGFYDVGTYVSSSIVLPKLMTDPVARRRDSRKRYREKMALLKVNQPSKKRGKKPKTASSQEENHEVDKPEAEAHNSVASQHDSIDASSADVTDQDKSMDASVQETEGETSLDTSAVVNDIDEGVEAAANLLEMAYSEAGMNEETMEESISESAVTGEILSATDVETKEDLEACLQNPDPQDKQITTDANETTEMLSQENVANAIETTEVVSQGTVASAVEISEVVSQKSIAEGSTTEAIIEPDVPMETIAEDAINQAINGEDKESQEVDAGGTPEAVSAGNDASSAEPITPTSKPSVLDGEMVLSFQEGVNIQKQTFSCSCGRGSGKNLKRTQFCLTLDRKSVV